MTGDPHPLVDRIPDEHIVQVLALLLEQQHRLPDPAQARQAQARLLSAATDPNPVEIVDDGSTDDQPVTPLEPSTTPINDTDLARAALVHLLSAQPELTEVALPRAVRLAADPPEGERLDPATLAVAGLVLVVLQTEIDWTRSSTGRWRLRVHKRAMRDSTLATLIRGLFTLPQPADPGSQTGDTAPAP